MQFNHIVDFLMYFIIFGISCTLSWPMLFIVMAAIPGNEDGPTLGYLFLYSGLLYPVIVVFSYSVVVYRIIKRKTLGYYPFLPIIYFCLFISISIVVAIVWASLPYYIQFFSNFSQFFIFK